MKSNTSPRPRAVRPASSAPSRGPLLDTFTARLVAVDEKGQGFIEWPAPPKPAGRGGRGAEPASARRCRARSTVELKAELVGREVLVCRANAAGEPVVVGVLQEPAFGSACPARLGASAPPQARDAGQDSDAVRVELSVPGLEDLALERECIVLSARSELVLRCGKGSIALSADGKVTIHGLDVVSSAERTQRIRGGAVRIN